MRLKQLARRHKFASVGAGSGFLVVKFLDRRIAEELRKRRPKEFRIVDDATAHVYVDLPPVERARALVGILEGPSRPAKA